MQYVIPEMGCMLMLNCLDIGGGIRLEEHFTHLPQLSQLSQLSSYLSD